MAATNLDEVASAIRAAAAAWRGGPDEEYYRRLAEAAVGCLDLPVAKGGTILTDKVIERLSAEAEAGYDVDQLRPRSKTAAELLREVRKTRPANPACGYGVHDWHFNDPSPGLQACRRCGAVYSMA